MSIADEEAFYKSNKAAIVQKYLGRWVVIKGGVIAGDYGSYEEAFSAGVAKFGAQGGFLVKQALEHEPVQKVGYIYGF